MLEAEVQLGAMSHLVELRSSSEDGIKLIRPDGYIAYEARGRTLDRAVASVRSLVERLTT